LRSGHLRRSLSTIMPIADLRFFTDGLNGSDSSRHWRSRENFRVWLARVDVPDRTGHLTGLPLVPNSTATRECKHLWCYTLTLSVGQFMFQTHAIRPGDSRRGDFTRLFPDVDTRWQRKVVQIWPCATHAEVAWPPPENVRNEELEVFCCRWGGRLSAGVADIAPL
jgi:hypothetical protein